MALDATSLKIVRDAVGQQVIGVIEQSAVSLVGPVDVPELALLAGLGVVVELLAERFDGFAHIIVVEVVTGGTLHTSLVVFLGAALEEID